MKIEKRNEYSKQMTLNGIHTLSGYLPKRIVDTDFRGKSVNCNVKQCNYQDSKERTYLLINPNKDTNSERLITSYSQFVKKMTLILNQMGMSVEDFDIIRCDFCFNSTNADSFSSYQKLHRLIISCLAKAYDYKNCYVSCGLWDWQRLSIAVKKDDSEIENYDKKRESNGTDESCNRLELRSKRMAGTTIEYQFMTKWVERLDKAAQCFDDVQKTSNEHLEKLYKEDLSRPSKERSYLSLTAFLLQYRECIYTRKQMVDLLSRIGDTSNPAKKADKFKAKHKIEYFSQKDLKYIISVLKQKTVEYFKS